MCTTASFVNSIVTIKKCKLYFDYKMMRCKEYDQYTLTSETKTTNSITTMKSIRNALTLVIIAILGPSVLPELKVKPPSPISGEPITAENEAYLAHFTKDVTC